MDFFGIGILEILFILIIALIIFGPGKLPEIARVMGRAMRTLRKATSDLTAQVTKEIEGQENDHPPRQPRNGGAQAGKSGSPASRVEPQRRNER